MTSCKICKEVTLVGRQGEPTTQLIPATLTFIVLEGGRRATRCVSNAGQAPLLSDGTCCQGMLAPTCPLSSVLMTLLVSLVES